MFTNTKIAFAAALILGTASTALARGDADEFGYGGHVMPCSLVGVNPAYHRGIFGNAAVAREYGFVKSRDSGWQVEKNCVRGSYHY